MEIHMRRRLHTGERRETELFELLERTFFAAGVVLFTFGMFTIRWLVT
jgi:hypothetical protein